MLLKNLIQCAKKAVSDSLGLVDITIRLVTCSMGKCCFLGEIQIAEGLQSILLIKKGFGASWNDLWASTCYNLRQKPWNTLENSAPFCFPPPFCNVVVAMQLCNNISTLQGQRDMHRCFRIFGEDCSYSLPKWQVVKVTFFAPYNWTLYMPNCLLLQLYSYLNHNDNHCFSLLFTACQKKKATYTISSSRISTFLEGKYWLSVT